MTHSMTLMKTQTIMTQMKISMKMTNMMIMETITAMRRTITAIITIIIIPKINHQNMTK
jgi:hypothetical protein